MFTLTDSPTRKRIFPALKGHKKSGFRPLTYASGQKPEFIFHLVDLINSRPGVGPDNLFDAYAQAKYLSCQRKSVDGQFLPQSIAFDAFYRNLNGFDEAFFVKIKLINTGFAVIAVGFR